MEDNLINEESGELEENWQPTNEFQLLRDIREVSRLLQEASENINETFAVSSTFCIFFEFVASFLSNYFYFEWAIKNENIWYACTAVVQLIPRCDNLLSMGTACEHATEEARRFKGCIQKMSFDSSNNKLTRLVSFI